MNQRIKIVGLMFVAVLVLSLGGIYLTRNLGKSHRTISKENAETELNKMVKGIYVNKGNPQKSAIDFEEEEEVGAELPDIKTCEITTKATTDTYAEI